MSDSNIERKPPPAPGIYDVSGGAEYAKWDALSHRRLARLERSAWAAHYFELHPEDEPEMGLGAELGIVAHAALLEPERFEAEYVCVPEGRSNSKEVTAAVARIIAEGKRPMRYDHHQAVKKMLESARAHPQVRRVFEVPERLVEQSAVAPHGGAYDPSRETGMLCKSRLDLALPGPSMAIEIKTTGRALSPDELSRQMEGWSLQLAMSEHVFTRAASLSGSPLEMKHYGVVVIEQKPPYECTVLFADVGTMDLARHRFDKLVSQWQRCEATGHWPRLGEEGPLGVAVKPWVFTQYGSDL